MRLGTLLLGLVLPLLLAGGAVAEPLRYAGMALEVPGAAEGWAPRSVSDGLLLQKRFPQGTRGRPGGAIIGIRQPEPAQGDFAARFATQAAAVQAVAQERPMRRATGLSADGHAMRMDERCCGQRGGPTTQVVTIGIDTGESWHFLTLVMLNLEREDLRATRAAFEAVVRSLRPREGRDQGFALRPPEGGGGLDGAYTHLSTGLMPNAFGGMDFRADNEILAFDPSGLFATALPAGEEGMAGLCARAPRDCGTYRLRGGRIEMLRVANGYGMLEVEEEPLVREGETLRIGGTTHRRLPPPPQGTPFEGRWTYNFASSGSTAFSSGSVAVQRVLALSRDGRFQRTGFNSASSTSSAGGGTTGFTAGRPRPAERGTYRVEGFALLLTGEDGRQERLSLFLPTPSSEDLLVIDGGNYLREGRERRR